MDNKLTLLSEFQSALNGYAPSDAAKQTLANIKLVLLLAPTSGGRNTVIRELVKTGNYYYIVSDTTRQPRVNNGIPEQNGVEYWFKSEREVLLDLEQGKYIAPEIIHDQQVSGMNLQELKKAQYEDKFGITDVDLEGVHTILAAKPDTVVILLLPPSFEEWQRRLRARGKMDEPELRRRFETATRIFEAGIHETGIKLVVTNSVENTMEAINQIVQSGQVDVSTQVSNRELAKKLLHQTISTLDKFKNVSQ